MPRGVFLILQWLWAFALTIFFLAGAGILGVFGGLVGWSGLRALFGLGNGVGEWWHAPVGLAMIAFGLLMAFVLMEPVVRKLSGRDPIHIPHH